MLKCKNKYFKEENEFTAEDLAAKVDIFLQMNAQAVGPVMTIAQMRAALPVADRVKLTRGVFNIVCALLGLEIVDAADAVI